MLSDLYETLRWSATGNEISDTDLDCSNIKSKLITGEIYFGTVTHYTRKTQGISLPDEIDFSSLESCYIELTKNKRRR